MNVVDDLDSTNEAKGNLQGDLEAEQEELDPLEVKNLEDELNELEVDDKVEEDMEGKHKASDLEEDIEACLEESEEDDEEVEVFKVIDMYSEEEEREREKDKVGNEKKTEEKKLGPSIPYRCENLYSLILNLLSDFSNQNPI